MEHHLPAGRSDAVAAGWGYSLRQLFRARIHDGPPPAQARRSRREGESETARDVWIPMPGGEYECSQTGRRRYALQGSRPSGSDNSTHNDVGCQHDDFQSSTSPALPGEGSSCRI